VGPFVGAKAFVQHFRPFDYDEKRKIWMYKEQDEGELVHNVITDLGLDQLHEAGYKASHGHSAGFSFIALSNDTVGEDATSTTLSNEISSNGLTRAAGTFDHTTTENTSTIDKTFTATGSQSAQKAALFDASSNGTMNHVLGFTQRALVTDDQLAITFTITLG
jgi:hypothetical protein